MDIVGARTLTVPNFGNSVVFVEVVSGVTTQNSLRGVGVESKSFFVINPWLNPGFRGRGSHGLSPWFCNKCTINKHSCNEIRLGFLM